MKRINKHIINVSLLTVAALITGCSDEFLKDKQDYTRVTTEVYNNYAGANARINDIYSLCLPESNTAVSYDNPSTGASDDYSTSTEEYGGLSIFVSDNQLTNESLPDYFYNEAKASRSPWGRIRNCNDAIAGINNGTLTDAEKKILTAQAYFFRAWTYYRLVKTYGGVPLVDYVQNPVVGSSDGSDLAIPRSTTKECIEFICKDLETAAAGLPSSWDDGNWGRITSGTALALEGRVRLLYASPLFNRTDDQTRWQLAYEVNKRAIDTLNASGFYGLDNLSTPGVNGFGWAKMFTTYQSPEAVFVTLYNNVAEVKGYSYDFNNTWENSIRPYNTGGGGGKSTTAEMVDLFPMKSGLRATDKDKNAINGYDKTVFFLNRDPRFYRTFGFPGVVWSFSGAAKKSLFPYSLYTTSSKYELWNYCWYESTTKQADEQLSGYGADKLGTNYKGIYVRKYTDDYGVNNKAPLYVYDSTTSTPFKRSATPYMEIRYAEVLLNFAEAACGAGHGSEALEALRLIRQRVGYTGTCGLDDALASDRPSLFAAILYERQIELAFEGKRFDDMRRWLLWDGGAYFSNIPGGAPSTWTLTGFGGNTCTYLGVNPLNGQRRNGMEMYVTTSGGIAAADPAYDPIITKGIKRPAAWDINTSDTIQRDTVANFYKKNLARKQRLVDTQNKYIQFRPEYYFLGLRTSAQTNNSTLLQTIGWVDSQKGGYGTFDPLAE